MSASLDQPVGVFANPGPDTQMGTIREHAQAILAIAGRDGILAPDEQRDIRDLVVGLQQIGQQRVMGQQSQQPSIPTTDPSATQDAFSEGGGAEGTEAPEAGAEFGGQ
jgi:hypothetical protein